MNISYKFYFQEKGMIHLTLLAEKFTSWIRKTEKH